MIKIILFSLIISIITYIIIKNFSKVKFFFKKILSNTIFRALIIRGIWRLIKFLILKR